MGDPAFDRVTSRREISWMGMGGMRHRMTVEKRPFITSIEVERRWSESDDWESLVSIEI